jgi:hypothetical protein
MKTRERKTRCKKEPYLFRQGSLSVLVLVAEIERDSLFVFRAEQTLATNFKVSVASEDYFLGSLVAVVAMLFRVNHPTSHAVA